MISSHPIAVLGVWLGTDLVQIDRSRKDMFMRGQAATFQRVSVIFVCELLAHQRCYANKL